MVLKRFIVGLKALKSARSQASEIAQEKISPFAYTSLNPATTEIRVLILHPGTWESQIRCDLEHVFLDQNPTYDALSYTWGDANNVRIIHLGGKLKKVTASLETALRYLRNAKTITRLWVDALCINQDDILERNQQVKRISDIYSSAITVTAWVGDPTHDSGSAMKLLTKIGAVMESDPEYWFNTSISLTNQRLQECGLSSEHKDWSALKSFLQRPYWTRIWIIQEIVKSGKFFDNRCVIKCGRDQVPLDMLIVTNMFINRVSKSMSTLLSTHNSVTELAEPAKSFFLTRKKKDGEITLAIRLCNVLLIAAEIPNDAQVGPKIENLIWCTGPFKASDHRDKIFALLGLANNVAKEFQPDYSKSVEQTYEELARAQIQHTGNLEILRGNRRRRNRFGPSWTIPDYLWQDINSEGSTTWTFPEVQFDASGEGAQFRFEDGGILHLFGVMVGVIDDFCGPFERRRKPNFNCPPLREQVARNRLRSFIDRHERLEEDIWRTLLLNIDMRYPGNDMMHPAPEELKICFDIAFRGQSADEATDLQPLLHRFSQVEENMLERCLFSTESGHIGLGPCGTKKGDLAVVLLGGKFCFVLRPDEGKFELVGDAYVHRAMHGEMIQTDAKGNIQKLEEFAIC